MAALKRWIRRKPSQKVDGVMVGRAAYKTPYFLADIDRLIFGAGEAPLSRDEIVERLIPYAEKLVAQNTPCMR